MSPKKSLSPDLGSMLPPDWRTLLSDTDAEVLEDLNVKLKPAFENGPVFPEWESIFRAFEFFSPSETKVVIVGQDPYHGMGQAQGFSFSVPDFCKYPPSLRNIFKELEMEFGSMPDSGDLSFWANQGVLLLNRVLTVKAGEAASHQGMGWEQFTSAVLRSLSEQISGLVFMLWGKPAQSVKTDLVKLKNHLILETSHPSPFSARKGFLGCDHFKLANQFLTDNNKECIQWVR